MIYTKGTIDLNGKTYEATKVDFNAYSKDDGQITLNGKTYKAHQILGVEEISENKYIVTQTILPNETCQLAFVKASSGSNLYDVTSTILLNNSQVLNLVED